LRRCRFRLDETQLTQTFSAPGTATLACTPTVQAMNYVQAKIIAVRLGSETHTAG